MTETVQVDLDPLQRATPADVPGRRVGLVVLGTAYLIFVIYGSLVPLVFQPMPLDVAMVKFGNIAWLQLGIDSRADWVANLLLFIPLAFFWSGAVWPLKSAALRVLACLAVSMACVGLAVGIEFTQLFFPQRTVSINDIVAEGVGGILGVWVWWQVGARFSLWLASLSLVRGTAGVAERLLALYLFVLLGYSMMPLDLTISPVELYHKWNDGRIWLIPFSARYDDSAHMIYSLLSDIVIWVPPALLWKMAYRQPGPTVWLYVVTSAAVIEFLQLFVYSRVTDTTSIITAAAGGLVGLWLAPGRQRRLAPHSHSRPPPAAIGLPMLWLGVLIWLVVVATVFWYPFDFNFDRAFVRDRLIALKQVPFNAYYFGSEFRAITEVIHKTGFMLPLGLLLGRIAHLSAARVPRGVWHAMATMLIVSVALGIEFGQLFLPTKNADLTDAFLEAAGGMLGYWGSLYVLALLQQPAHRTPP